jgi:hypothetical protein
LNSDIDFDFEFLRGEGKELTRKASPYMFT